MLASSGIMHRTAKANENGIRRCWIRIAYLHKRPPRLIPHPILSQRIHVIRVQTYTYTRIYIDAAGGMQEFCQDLLRSNPKVKPPE